MSPFKIGKFRAQTGPQQEGAVTGPEPNQPGLPKGEKVAPVSEYDEHDEEMRDLSAIDRKLLLINRSTNKMGMGRYQWCLFALTGFG